MAAETAGEAKSMFLANISHEVRTPLNGMLATAQLLLSSALSPEQRELAETLLESGNRLLTILGDILDFSQVCACECECVCERGVQRAVLPRACCLPSLRINPPSLTHPLTPHADRPQRRAVGERAADAARPHRGGHW